MWKCKECEKTFDEPRIKHTTYEDYYEVGSEFGSKNSMTLYLCPHCDSEEVDELSSSDIRKEELLEELNACKTVQQIQDFCEQEEDVSWEIECGTIYVDYDYETIFEKELESND